MIDFGAPYSATWRVFSVDERTWADGDRMYGVTTASVNREADGNLLESGTFTIDLPYGESIGEGYYRLVMTAHQNGVAERVDVATLHGIASGSVSDKGRNLQTLNASSVLYPASTEKTAVGWYAPAGVNGAQFVAEMLAGCLKAPVSWEGSFTLDSPIVFQLGWSKLECAWTVLDAGNFTLAIDGRGRVTVRPMPTEPSLALDGANARLVGTSVSRKTDWSVVPNRYYAVDGSEVAVAVNDDPNSVTSTVSRGYNSDVVDRSPKRVNGETLEAYAGRRLHESSIVLDTRTYTREWVGGVYPNSIVLGSIPSVGLDGRLRVTSQKLTLGKGIKVDETAGMEVSSWP